MWKPNYGEFDMRFAAAKVIFLFYFYSQNHIKYAIVILNVLHIILVGTQTPNSLPFNLGGDRDIRNCK